MLLILDEAPENKWVLQREYAQRCRLHKQQSTAGKWRRVEISPPIVMTVLSQNKNGPVGNERCDDQPTVR